MNPVAEFHEEPLLLLDYIAKHFIHRHLASGAGCSFRIVHGLVRGATSLPPYSYHYLDMTRDDYDVR